METEGVIPVHLLLATAAKVLCSAVFLSGRDEAEALHHSAFHALQVHHLPDLFLPLVQVEVDRATRQVTLRLRLDPATAGRLVTGYRDHYPNLVADWAAETERLLRLGTIARTARFLGDQGSVILRRGDDRLFFTPVPVRSALPAADTMPWPMGDRTATPAHPRIAQAIAGALADADACSVAVVVLHKGEIVGEGYAPGFSRETQLESWSMGKSLTATLVGRLIQNGLLSLDQPAPIAAWQHPEDPRRAITVRDLLQMSSGLRFSGHHDPRGSWASYVPDHFYIYTEAIDVFDFAISRPAEFAPQTVGRYRNCDPLALGYIVKQIVTGRLGRDYLTWPQAELFDRIGIRRQVLETDLYGNFLLTGFDYGTARNWARLGLLYLRDGVWQGQRLLPEGWCDFVSTPAPAWEQPVYGGQFWLNRTREFALPDDAYMMAGSGQQRVFVVPSVDLVVVRMGHVCAHSRAAASVNVMLREIIASVSA
jgi:CubicO group peptidase (beta-lactamase class C family)